MKYKKFQSLVKIVTEVNICAYAKDTEDAADRIFDLAYQMVNGRHPEDVKEYQAEIPEPKEIS